MTVQSNDSSLILAEVRAELARRQMSGRQLAEAMHATSMYVSRRLSGKVPMSVDDLTRIATVLNVPVSRFFPEAVAA